MIRFEPHFRLDVLHMEIALVMHHASVWSQIAGVDVVFNHGADGKHMDGSLHGWSLALDVDTEGDFARDTVQLFGYLERVLPPGYDVVPHESHVHVELDRQRKRAKVEPLVRRAPASRN